MENDLISRQWLMECVDEGWIKFDTEKDANTYIHLVRDIAPSAHPERTKGRWNDDTYCDQCGWTNEVESGFIGSVKGFHFCPNCGAEMRSKEDGE